MPRQLPTGSHDTSDRASPVSMSTNLKRRGFLLALGAGGASVAVVAARALSGGVVQPLNATAVVEVVTAGGYTATEHIRKYYRTTKT